LVLLGKRVQMLRAAKKWSQEEFAHISGFHRTYIGQIERGEKNISFSNLSKVASVLGLSLSELLSGLEERQEGSFSHRSKQRGERRSSDTFKLQKLVKQLRIQQSAMDRVTASIEELARNTVSAPRGSDRDQKKSRSGRK
jgi:transcriptional regulator with XRE-family HTH domain